ncbi:DUF4190 domain-containing protein [Curtobacterium pusillum]|uniref:DUF4190 domain-containing protein n=1 Tax=Curtobacterium pusillum TaxID=69373 RepID=UPI001643C032|nr:DUF4190 domain-containing protein [Curtobacterium pusillum]
MSDQNQWPKPGETDPGRDASVGGQPQEPGAGQYGGSAPEAPHTPQGTAASDPWAQSGQGAAAQGVSEGQTAPQNPYAAPAQQHNPYGAPNQQQNPYAAPSHQQNPYAAPGQPQNPYAAPHNPYAAPQNPYAAPQNQYAQNPYAAPQNPYAAPGYSGAGYQPYAQRPKTNTLAVLSIVFGLGAVPLFFMAILLGPAGAILGHIALGKIKENGEGGRGLALTGIIAGWVMTGFWILWIIGLVWLGTIGSSYSHDYDYGTDSGAFIG